MNVTRSLNMTKVSPRLHNIQNDVKSKGTRIQDLQDPLASFCDFRGLVLPDCKKAMSRVYPVRTIH